MAELPPPTLCPLCRRTIRVGIPSAAGGVANYEACPGGPWVWSTADRVMHRPGAGRGSWRLHTCELPGDLDREVWEGPAEPAEGSLF